LEEVHLAAEVVLAVEVVLVVDQEVEEVNLNHNTI
jgi:hypothetical protein